MARSSARRVFVAQAAKRADVDVMPLSPWAISHPLRPSLRLGYSGIDETDIRTGSSRASPKCCGRCTARTDTRVEFADHSRVIAVTRRVIGTAPTVLNANGANQKKFDESLLVRRRMKSQRARTNIFFGTAAQDATRNVPGVGSKEKQNSAVHRSRPGQDATVISSEELAQFRLIRPIRVQTCWSRPDDRRAFLDSCMAGIERRNNLRSCSNTFALPAERHVRDDADCVPRLATAQGYPFSQRSRLEQDIALNAVEVTYGRPVARGRELFGALVPWDSIWHPGADSATRISFSETSFSRESQ